MAARFPNGRTIPETALSFAIWREAERHGWDITLTDLAEAVDKPLARVKRTVASKGWTNKLRREARWSDDVAEAVAPFQRVGAAE